MKSLVQKMESLPSIIKIVIGSFFSAIPVYFAGFMSYSYAQAAAFQKPYNVIFHFVVIVILLTMVISVAGLYKHYKNSLERDKRVERELLLHSYNLCDRLISEKLYKLKDNIDSDLKFVDAYIVSLNNIKQIVYAAYSTFEGTFGKSIDVKQRIDFEVTFMTKSYKDGGITIPASANRDNKSPRSMILTGV